MRPASCHWTNLHESPREGLNPVPADYRSAALPGELQRLERIPHSSPLLPSHLGRLGYFLDSLAKRLAGLQGFVDYPRSRRALDPLESPLDEQLEV